MSNESANNPILSPKEFKPKALIHEFDGIARPAIESMGIDALHYLAILHKFIKNPAETTAISKVLHPANLPTAIYGYDSYGHAGQKIPVHEEETIVMRVSLVEKFNSDYTNPDPVLRFQIGGYSQQSKVNLALQQADLFRHLSPGGKIYTLASQASTRDEWKFHFDRMSEFLTGSLENTVLGSVTMTLQDAVYDPNARQVAFTNRASISMTQFLGHTSFSVDNQSVFRLEDDSHAKITAISDLTRHVAKNTIVQSF